MANMDRQSVAARDIELKSALAGQQERRIRGLDGPQNPKLPRNAGERRVGREARPVMLALGLCVKG